MVQLIPMNKADYERFLDWAVSDYAQEKVRAGTWKPEDARQLAEGAFESLLPEGLSSPNQYLCMVGPACAVHGSCKAF